VQIAKVASASFVTVATAQLSEVVGVPRVTPDAEHDAPAFTVTFAGAVMDGDCVSFTVTWNEHDDPKVLVHVTVVIPTGKNDPEAWSHVTVPGLVGAAYVTAAPQAPESFPIVMSAGHVNTHDDAGAPVCTSNFTSLRLHPHAESYATTRQCPTMCWVPLPLTHPGGISESDVGSVKVNVCGSAVTSTVVYAGAVGRKVHSLGLPPADRSRNGNTVFSIPPLRRNFIVSPGAKTVFALPHVSRVSMPT